MATRNFYAGATYCDATPGGAWCVLFPTRYQDHADGSFTVLEVGRIESHLGTIAIPAQEIGWRGQGPLMLRCTDVGGGGFQMCGKPHQGLGTWTWDLTSGAWTLNPTDSCGVSGHIFDQTGALFISSCAFPGPGSQGYRYVDDTNTLILGHDTYADLARNLYEYSEYDCGGTWVAVGQGGGNGPTDFGGAWAVTGQPGVSTLRRFLLETDFKWFIRFKHAGTALSIAIWSVRPDPGAIIRFMDVSDLVAGGLALDGGGGVAMSCG